jgi:hypothetical protein
MLIPRYDYVILTSRRAECCTVPVARLARGARLLTEKRIPHKCRNRPPAIRSRRASPYDNRDGSSLTSDTPETSRKAQIDALLLKLPGVSARKINGLDAYFVSDKMFACISGNGIGLRLSAAAATELQFSRDNIVPFQPGGMASSREWVQIDRADAADYEKDLDLFRASLEYVKAARSR